MIKISELYQRIRLSECAVCPYAHKKYEGKLYCGWDNPTSKEKCEKIRKCGSFSVSISLAPANRKE